MKPIKSVDYIYHPNGKDIKECLVTFLDGTKKIAKTSYELNEIQTLINQQQRQILIETPPNGKPV